MQIPQRPAQNARRAEICMMHVIRLLAHVAIPFGHKLESSEACKAILRKPSPLDLEPGKRSAMLSTTTDSELMVQHVAAVAVPNCSTFFTVADENGLPMVFSIGTDQKFYIIKEDIQGAHILSDFGSLLDLPEGYVAHALSVTQDADSNIYIVLAIEDSDSTTNSDPDRIPSTINVLKPFKPGDIDLGSPNTGLCQLLLKQTGTNADLRAWAIFAVSALIEMGWVIAY
jgi:hypothetical protein